MMVLIATRFSDSRVTGLKKLPIRFSEPIHGRKNNEHVECQRSPLALTVQNVSTRKYLLEDNIRTASQVENSSGGK